MLIFTCSVCKQSDKSDRLKSDKFKYGYLIGDKSDRLNSVVLKSDIEFSDVSSPRNLIFLYCFSNLVQL